MKDTLARNIIGKIAGHAEKDESELTRETELSELGIHSLELTEIIFDIEEEYGIEVQMDTAEAWSRLKTIGDVIDAIGSLIEAKG